MNLKTVVAVGIAGLGLWKAYDICINMARFCTIGAIIGRMYDENLVPEAKDMVDDIYAKYKDDLVKVACCVRAYKYGFENPNDILNAK
jgi:hypothetical protein